jgi:hypothetical protein
MFDVYFTLHKNRMLSAMKAATWQDFRMDGTGIGGSYAYTSAVDENGVPNLLYINGRKWLVVKVNHYTDIEGTPPGVMVTSINAQTYCEHHVITYIPTENPQTLRVNLMHEVFHAGRCDTLQGDDYWNSPAHPANNSDHQGVYRLGEFMAMFLHDNPTFAAWEMR